MWLYSHWLEALSEADSLDVLSDISEAAALSAGCSEGTYLAGLVRKGDLRKVCEFVVPLDGSLPPEKVKRLRQAVALFSKLDFLNVGVDREQVAVEAFMDAEAHCRETNAIWQGWHEGWIKFPPRVSSVFHMAQGHVQRILGPRPDLDRLKLRFGPGATSLTKKRESSIKRKLGKGVSCSDDLVGWARALLQQMPHLAEIHATTISACIEEFWGIVPVVIHTGSVSFVRKNWKTDRTTETQPTLNGMLQLAIGDYMAEAMASVPGLDLRDQSLNRRLAYVGSLTGEVATLDLTSASNCVAVRPVQSLFPEDWFSLLKAARVGVTKVPTVGEIKLEMFSGMGNGFTFPLQSVLFYSIAKAVATYLKRPAAIVSVYGDDIIVDTEMVPLLVECLTVAGLIVNQSKSYWSGPFRESCGADFLSGIDVRPVFVKSTLTPAVLFALHNGLVRKGMQDLASMVETFIHPDLLLYGPDEYGDGHLIREDWKTYARPKGRSRGFEGFTFATFVRSSKKDWVYHPGDRILHTYAVYNRGTERLLKEDVPGLSRRFVDPHSNVTVRRPWGDLSFVRAWVTGRGTVEEPSLSIPFGDKEESWGPCEANFDDSVISDDGGCVSLMWQGLAKACPFPGEDGYRKIAIYTLG